MSAAVKLWLVIVAVGGLNYLSRLSFIALFARWDAPPLVSRALRQFFLAHLKSGRRFVFGGKERECAAPPGWLSSSCCCFGGGAGGV